MRGLGLFMVGLMALALAACSGAMTCTTITSIFDQHATCSGTLDKLDGSHVLNFRLEDLTVNNPVKAQINISVVGGTVVVRYQNGDGQNMTYQVTPGNPLALRDTVSVVMMDEAHITLEAVGGTASGVQYSAEFTR